MTVGQLLFFPGEGRLALSVLNFLQYFLVGFLLADVYLCDWNEAPLRRLRWDIVSLIGWSLLLVLFEWPRATSLLLPFLLFWLYYSVFRGVYVRHLLTRPLLTIIGGMCYTIYLIHFQLISFGGRLFSPIEVSKHFFINYLLTLPVFLFILTIASVAFFVCVEKPCMRKDWPSRLRVRLRALVTPPQTKLEKPVVQQPDHL